MSKWKDPYKLAWTISTDLSVHPVLSKSVPNSPAPVPHPIDLQINLNLKCQAHGPFDHIMLKLFKIRFTVSLLPIS